jgi:hypothetical protein
MKMCHFLFQIYLWQPRLTVITPHIISQARKLSLILSLCLITIPHILHSLCTLHIFYDFSVSIDLTRILVITDCMVNPYHSCSVARIMSPNANVTLQFFFPGIKFPNQFGCLICSPFKASLTLVHKGKLPLSILLL